MSGFSFWFKLTRQRRDLGSLDPYITSFPFLDTVT
jgi:hypothetical protein